MSQRQHFSAIRKLFPLYILLHLLPNRNKGATAESWQSCWNQEASECGQRYTLKMAKALASRAWVPGGMDGSHTGPSGPPYTFRI